MHQFTPQFIAYCKDNLDLTPTPTRVYNYKSLSICIIACIYSLRTRANVTDKVVERYANKYLGGDKDRDTTIIAAITSELDKAHLPTHVLFTAEGMKKKSMALLEQIRTIDRTRLSSYVETVDDKTMKQIDHAIVISFGLEYL